MSLAEKLSDFVRESLGLLFGSGLEEIIIQIGGTILLVIVVRKYFWKPLTEFLDKRKAFMQEEMAAAELMKNEALKIKEDTTKEISDLRQTVASSLEIAKKNAEKERESIVSKAKEDANRIKKQAEIEIERDIEKAQAQIKKEIITVAKALTEKVISENMDDKKYETWVDKAASEVDL